jgi:hypothetical protein
MSRYKTDQRYVLHRGRAFHFVSYEARQADPRTGTEAMSATWFLMSGGKRWAAVPQIPDQDEKALITELIRWLDTHVFER